MKPFSNLQEDLRKWFSKTDPEGGWKRINSKGEAIGPCAREPGEPKPKCMSNEKRAKLTKKERASAVRAKREHDPNPERKGEPINVSNFGKGKISESSTEKYLEEKNVPTNPELWSRAKSMARSKFDVYPSAYANGWASKWYKSKGGGWKSQTDESFENFVVKEEIKDKMSETKKTKKVLKKKLNKEDNSIALGYEFGNNGIGDQFGVIRSPSGLGFGYSLPMSEAQTFTSIRENWEAIGGRDMGIISKQGKEEVDESSPAWQRSAGKNPEGGLNKKGIASYRAEHPGSKLSLAVTEKPSELKAGSKKAKRRLSFCRRMKGMKAKLTSAKTARDPDSRINKSLRKWNCEE